MQADLDSCLFACAALVDMFTTATPNLSGKFTVQPGGGGDEGEIAAVTAWRGTRGDAVKTGVSAMISVACEPRMLRFEVG